MSAVRNRPRPPHRSQPHPHLLMGLSRVSGAPATPWAGKRSLRGMQPPSGPVPAPLDGPGAGVSDARELLLGYLEWYREALMRKIDGLSDERLRTPVEPLGWSPLGLVQHLGWVERRWMRWGFAAEDVVPWPPGGDDSEFRADGSPDAILAAYEEEVRRGREIVAGASLTDVAA